ncbi:hypothetical protein QCA50_007007 [Cerrena zonata]|uniref:Uncharacterized protein n=1 Tax=Cerrena zonata TaxID=2478898 RepID=A0AAW0GGU6_9APHY
MAVMDNAGSPNGEMDITMRLWNLLNEVSDQLNQNRSISNTLHNIAGGVKAQAIHSQTGFVLRKYNLDKTQEDYDAELERMNAAMSAENQSLVNDSKQLGALIKEYEQTLENVMTTFRKRANEVQERELAIIREYETKLLIHETEELVKLLENTTSQSSSLTTLGVTLRMMMRSLQGEEPEYLPEDFDADGSVSRDPTHIASSLSLNLPSGVNSLELNETEVAQKEKELAAAEWALERECELARLERENEHLRNLLAGHAQIGSMRVEDNKGTLKELPKVDPLPKTKTISEVDVNDSQAQASPSQGSESTV